MAQYRGIGRVFRRTDSRFWWLSLWVGPPGKRRRHIESSKSVRKEDAVNLLQRRVEQYRAIPGLLSRATVGEVLDDYLRDLAAREVRALDRFERQATIVREHLGGRVAQLLEPGEVYEMQQTLRRKYAPATVNFLVGFLRSSFRHAARNGRIERRLEFPRALPVNNARRGYIEHKMYLEILDELPEWGRDIFRVGYYSGWRLGEVVSLSWDEVDVTERVLNLSPARSKNGEGREIPFLGEIELAISRRHAARVLGSPWVFHHYGKPWSKSTFGKAFREACIIAGYPKVLFHDCRGTAYTNLLDMGVRPKVAQLMVGWTSATMPARYERVRREDKEDAAAKVRAFLDAKTAEAQARVLPFAKGEK